MRSDNRAMRTVANYTQILPHIRDKKQREILKQINNTKGIDLEIEVDPYSNKISDAILYNPPKITMKKQFTPLKGNFNIKDPIYSQGAKIDKWILVCEPANEKLAMEVVN